MTRLHGPLLCLLLLLMLAGTRCVGRSRSTTLVENEQRTRALVGRLLEASLDAVSGQRPHPGLRGDFVARFEALTPRPELGSESVSYADDGAYLYGLAAATTHGDEGAAPRHGFILRAWPLDFGDTGDLEFQATEDGRIWEGLNSLGRSGTEIGFPPTFPDADLNRSEAGWMPLPEGGAAHR